MRESEVFHLLSRIKQKKKGCEPTFEQVWLGHAISKSL